MNTGDRIKALRKQKRMSAEKLAAICGVSPATIYRYEKGDIENMRTDKLTPIAAALGTTSAYLMGWADDPVDYDDGQLIAEIPKAYLDHFNGDVKKAYRAMQSAWGDSIRENKKVPDTLIDVEDLSEDKRYLVKRIIALPDETVHRVRTIVDQVLDIRGD